MGLLARIALAVVIGVLVALACILVGGLLITLEISFAVVIGEWLKNYAAVFGLAAALWYFLRGGGWTITKA